MCGQMTAVDVAGFGGEIIGIEPEPLTGFSAVFISAFVMLGMY